jgi:integrase
MSRSRGQIHKRGNRWEFRVFYQEGSGASGRRSVSGSFRTRDEAQRAMTRKLAELDNGDVPRATGTVSEFLRWWLTVYETSGTVRPVTVRKRAQQLGYWEPVIGSLPVAKLTTGQLQRAVGEIRERGRVRGSDPLAPKTINGIVDALQKALSDGIRHGILTRNPAEQVVRPKSRRPEIKAWDSAQVAAFLASSERNEEWLAPVWRLMAATGIRISEARGLRWADVHLDPENRRGYIEIRQARTGTGKREALGEPKTDAGKRRVTILDGTVDALVRFRKAQESEARRLECAPFEYVVSEPYGTPIKYETCARRFRASARAAGVPEINLHGLRHTSATLQLSQGIGVHNVAGRLGHSTPVTTLGFYAHHLPRADELVAATIERTLDGGPTIVLPDVQRTR